MEQITLKKEVKGSKSHLRRETGQIVLLVNMLDFSKGKGRLALCNTLQFRFFALQKLVGQPAFDRPWGISGISNSDWDSQLGFLLGLGFSIGILT